MFEYLDLWITLTDTILRLPPLILPPTSSSLPPPFPCLSYSGFCVRLRCCSPSTWMTCVSPGHMTGDQPHHNDDNQVRYFYWAQYFVVFRRWEVSLVLYPSTAEDSGSQFVRLGLTLTLDDQVTHTPWSHVHIFLLSWRIWTHNVVYFLHVCSVSLLISCHLHTQPARTLRRQAQQVTRSN